MPDRTAIDRTNEVIKYLHALDLAMANAGGFRALLEELDARELPQVTGPQVQAIHMDRAGVNRWESETRADIQTGRSLPAAHPRGRRGIYPAPRLLKRKVQSHHGYVAVRFRFGSKGRERAAISF